MQASNMKKIRATRIDTKGKHVVTVGGKNAAGKTAVLDCIVMALFGKEGYVKQPLRTGAKAGFVELQLSGQGYRVRRAFNSSGRQVLEMWQADGTPIKGAVGFLKTLTGGRIIDPKEFEELDDAAQVKTLQNLMGVDSAPLEREIAILYDERTVTNREAARLKGALASMTLHHVGRDEPVDTAKVMAELEAAQESNEEKRQIENKSAQWDAEVTRLQDHAAGLKVLLEEAKAAEASAREQMKAYDLQSTTFVEIDTAPLRKALEEAADINQRVAENKRYKETEQELLTAQNTSDQQTELMAAKKADIHKMVSEAKTPIDGLAYDEVGLSYKGVLFSECSQAERLRVSTAIGMALAPEIKVLVIHDGSLLDNESQRAIEEVAEAHGGQLFIEKVVKDPEHPDEDVTFLIEDGEVSEVEHQAAVEAYQEQYMPEEPEVDAEG